LIVIVERKLSSFPQLMQVTDHLFIFEGNGDVIDFPGTLSEYASTLIEHENESIFTSQSSRESSVLDGNGRSTGKESYKDDKAKRNEYRNNIRQMKKDMDNLEKSTEKLKRESIKKQKEIDENSSSAGWSVLAALTDEVNKIKETIERQEMQWMEFAEQLEITEIEF
jgi:ABC transport system ATP-binding/permease protein